MHHNPWRVLKWSPSINAWWAQVTLTPDETKTIVLSKGTWKGLKVEIPKGGQRAPTSVLGAKLEWKKAQKNLKKKKISETIKRAIPPRNPSSTMEVWRPWVEPSREISRHHWIITNIIIKRPIIINFISERWNHLTIPLVRNNPPMEPRRGQGDSSTIW